MPNSINWPGWDVINCIGKGGFGAVYEIRREVFGDEERCALKVITIPKDVSEIEYMRCEGMDDDSITNTLHSQVGDIVNEYKLMARMRQNPNIVHCDDFRYTRHENDLGWDIFIKMELLTPLLKVLDRMKDEKEIVRLGVELCNALVACQKHNIIHRDIKPQNIFISPEGYYKLGDFGIARTMEHTTMATAGVGTHSFMAPEVARGEKYDHTVDIYSLGLVLYWMLNERRGPFVPLQPQVPTHTDNDKARMRRYAGEPIPVPKNGSKKLKAIVLKACAFNPTERYQTAREMQEALKTVYSILNGKNNDQEIDEENDENGEAEKTVIDSGSREDAVITHKANKWVCSKCKSINAEDICERCGYRQQSESQEGGEQGRKNRWVVFLPVILIAIVASYWALVNGINKMSVLEDDATYVHATVTEQQTVNTTGKNVLDRMFFEEICTEIEKECSVRYGDSKSSLTGYRASLKFYDSLEPAPSNAVDVSEKSDGSVLAWWYISESDCEIYVAAEKGVIAPKNCRELFAGATILREINFNRSFITDNVTDMSYMFSQCVNLEHIDFSGFVTSNVTTMRWMFYSCRAIEELDVSMFDTAKVTDMGKMFNACENLYDLNLDGFQMSNVTDKEGMFAGAYKVIVEDSICDHTCIPAGYYDGRIWVEGFQCEECEAFFENEYSFYIDAVEMVPGKTFEFGVYEQDNDASNGKEPIEWIVLAREGNEALVVSVLGLDTLPYEAAKETVDWENCSMRTWLEDTFYEATFSSREKRSIAEKNIIQHSNKGYPNCDQGINTNDHVFLLSAYEYSEYLYNNKAIDAQYREGVPSPYVLRKGIDKHESYKGERCWWWLRTSSRYNEKACFVNALGPSEVYVGYPIDKTGGMIRPAMWIALN